MNTLLNMGVTLLKKTICCGNNSPNRKGKLRCMKLFYVKQPFMFGILNLKAWANAPIAPPIVYITSR